MRGEPLLPQCPAHDGGGTSPDVRGELIPLPLLAYSPKVSSSSQRDELPLPERCAPPLGEVSRIQGNWAITGSAGGPTHKLPDHDDDDDDDVDAVVVMMMMQL